MQNLSPSRERLASLIAERGAASSELASLTARANRLARAKETIQALESELVALNIAETGAMSRWAESDDGSPLRSPMQNAVRRSMANSSLLALKLAPLTGQPQA